jgi:16S rRNA (uracil1498-N3)-methyltransferase
VGRTSSAKHSVVTGSAPRFFAPETLTPGEPVRLGEDPARHMRVLRMGVGAPVVLLDGAGMRAHGTLRSLAKRNATIEIDSIGETAAPPVIHALVPIADRDRMLWLAEKMAELAVSSWRPVMWKRSRSVSPRGEGPGFQGKVRLRMISALEQSGNAWLPSIYPDATIDRALSALPVARCVVLDREGTPIAKAFASSTPPLVIAIGPEGGFEPGEIAELADAGFERTSLAPMTLRFETAGIAALAHARAAFSAQGDVA